MKIVIGLYGGRGALGVSIDPVGRLSFDLSRFPLAAIPYGLAYLNRFGGQGGPYSDAQHSVILAHVAARLGHDRSVQAACLLHDAGEPLGAGDTNTHLKHALGASRLADYESGLCEALWVWTGCASRFGGDYASRHVALHMLDRGLGTAEAEVLGLSRAIPADAVRLPESVRAFALNQAASIWSPRRAMTEWQRAWEEVTG